MVKRSSNIKIKMELKKLLELRKKIKSTKPDFVRQDFHKKRFKKKWRKAKGLHSKVRLMLKGKPKKISTGYRAPKKVRGLHKSGLKPVLVKSLKDINKIKKENEGAVIGSNVGLRKRLVLLNKLKEAEVKVLNIKDVDAYLKNIENELNVRKDRKKEVKEKKEKKKEEKPKKVKKLTEKITEEEKKEQEKKEKDKLLTKKV